MVVQGKIAAYAKGEMPEDWRALEDSEFYGPSFLERKVNSVMVSLFGVTLNAAAQDLLDERVAEYAGKRVALSIINPSLSYWSKQPVSLGATGRNETKAWANRMQALPMIRDNLIAELNEMWPEVMVLLPNRRTQRAANVPRVIQAGATVAHKTPDPDDFEEPFAPSGA
jgi:hypothetical protein